MTSDWIAALISDGVSVSLIQTHVIVVQHSGCNENNSTSTDWAYVQSNTTYIAIDDGNEDFDVYTASRPDRGPEETPNYVATSSFWLDAATNASNPNAHTRDLWTEANQIIVDSGFNASWSEIPDGGVDFSDCVENWWIFDLGTNADSVATFWDRYVVNPEPPEPPTLTMDDAPIGRGFYFPGRQSPPSNCRSLRMI